MCGAGQGDVHLYFPRTPARNKGCTGKLIGIGRYYIVARRPKLQHVIYLLPTDAIGIIDVPVGTGDGHDLGAQLCGFGGSSPCHVAEARDSHRLALNIDAPGLKHFIDEVKSSEARGLGADERAAELQAFAGESACELARQLLVHAEHVAYLSAAHTYISGGYIHIGPHVTPEFEHEGLAEAHDFGVALTAWREVRASLGTPHGQGGQRVLEGLLEAQELQYREVDRSMEAYATLVGTDGVVELYAIAQVGLYLALVVHPSDTESKYSVGLDQALYNLGLLKLGMLVVNVFNRQEHFLDCLQVFRFTGMLSLQRGHDTFNVHTMYYL